jgi:hypothetical protein
MCFLLGCGFVHTASKPSSQAHFELFFAASRENHASLRTSPLRRLGGREEVSLKKYLYVFRPLLACRWIERQLGQVPMLFAQLAEGVLDEADVRAALAELVARKQAGEELAVAPPVEALTRFIEAELPRLEALNEPDDAAAEVEELNGFFRRYALAA